MSALEALCTTHGQRWGPMRGGSCHQRTSEHRGPPQWLWSCLGLGRVLLETAAVWAVRLCMPIDAASCFVPVFAEGRDGCTAGEGQAVGHPTRPSCQSSHGRPGAGSAASQLAGTPVPADPCRPHHTVPVCRVSLLCTLIYGLVVYVGQRGGGVKGELVTAVCSGTHLGRAFF